MIDINNPLYISLAILMAAASGVVGSFAVMRRMALASDPISHIALPGLGLAMLLDINPILGAGAALLLGALTVWALEKKTGISTEIMIGIIFSLALAVGSMMPSTSEEMIEELFGSYEAISAAELALGAVLAVGIICFVLARKNQLTLAILSPELAKSSGLNVSRINLEFLLAFVATILLGLRFSGVLLMGSLIIIPAAIGKQLGRSFKSMMAISVVASALSVLLGILISNNFQISSGSSIIITAASLFFLSLIVKPKE